MKSFWTIFSFYILILSALPCTDREECSLTNVAQTEHSHEGHSHEKDHCTPFCICSCCGINTTIEIVPDFDFTQLAYSLDIPKQVSHYKAVYTDNYFAPIWQPPKISA